MYEIGIIKDKQLINIFDINQLFEMMTEKGYHYWDNDKSYNIPFTMEKLINVIDRLIALTSMQLNTVICQYDIEVHRTNGDISIFFIADY